MNMKTVSAWLMLTLLGVSGAYAIDLDFQPGDSCESVVAADSGSAAAAQSTVLSNSASIPTDIMLAAEDAGFAGSDTYRTIDKERRNAVWKYLVMVHQIRYSEEVSFRLEKEHPVLPPHDTIQTQKILRGIVSNFFMKSVSELEIIPFAKGDFSLRLPKELFESHIRQGLARHFSGHLYEEALDEMDRIFPESMRVRVGKKKEFYFSPLTGNK